MWFTWRITWAPVWKSRFAVAFMLCMPGFTHCLPCTRSLWGTWLSKTGLFCLSLNTSDSVSLTLAEVKGRQKSYYIFLLSNWFNISLLHTKPLVVVWGALRSTHTYILASTKVPIQAVAFSYLGQFHPWCNSVDDSESILRMDLRQPWRISVP